MQHVNSSATPNHEIKKQIFRASVLMMVSIFLSRVIGFFREWVLAQTVGASATTDVYYASFTIPDVLNYLMAAGALGISLIPMLTQYQARGDEERSRRLFRVLSTAMGSVLLALIVVAEIFAEGLARLIAPGFDAAQIELLAYLVRIILPAQFFFYWGGLAVAVQQTHGRFLLPAIAPIIYNAGIILCGLLLHNSHGVIGFSVGVLVGSVVGHGLLQWWGLGHVGFSSLPLFSWTQQDRVDLKRYLALTFPIMLGFSIVVTDEWISKFFASQLESRAVSWLSYARTEMRIPVAIIGQAAGIASFPYLARLWSEKSYENYLNILLSEAKKLWILGPLAAIVTFQHALPITHFLFGGTRFKPEDLANTASALRYFSFGIFFWTLQVLLARAFYACQKTWIPPLIGGVVSILSIPLYGHLAKTMSFDGLALAGSISIAVYCGVLSLFLFLHLRHHAPGYSFRPFLLFCGKGVLLIGFGAALSQAVLKWGPYCGDRLSALGDILLVGSLLGGYLLLLRSFRGGISRGNKSVQ